MILKPSKKKKSIPKVKRPKMMILATQVAEKVGRMIALILMMLWKIIVSMRRRRWKVLQRK